MKLLVDFQGAQSIGSGKRGIGRYSRSLVEAMTRRAGSHELLIGLNDAFPDTVEAIRAELDSVFPQENILCWQSTTDIADWNPLNLSRRKIGEVLRESFLLGHKPDIVHISSFFEGQVDDAITSTGGLISADATAVTLYDLIPLVHDKVYLTDSRNKAWYMRKVEELKKSGLLLAISESSRQEAIDLLGLDPELVLNISTAADSHFRPVTLSDDNALTILEKYGLNRPFVMYTGGIDHRKNIEGLISAFAGLPKDVREQHQLAIVCSANPDAVDTLKRQAKRCGLGENDLIMTGFVPEEDLVALYNLCRVFCFPSLHEGFGLPALEAMQCGAPTIGSNLTSIPEVIARDDALFDPRIEKDITARLYQSLTDDAYRQSLIEHGLKQAKNFSWDESARRAWSALEQQYARLSSDRKSVSSIPSNKRPSLAYISPLPPERSGIADYSAEILPSLSEFYDITVVVSQESVDDDWINENCSVKDVKWFEENSLGFDRIVYHFGNSSFHSHMFDLIKKAPGVVVLHDFYLSGIVAHMATYMPGIWDKYLYASHGYQALKERHHSGDWARTVFEWPVNAPILQRSVGIITHSEFSRSLASRFYDEAFMNNWEIVPHARSYPDLLEPEKIRAELGFTKNDFIVCSFGIMGRTKQNDRLLKAWIKSGLSRKKNCHLIFVGQEDSGDYREIIRSLISKCNSKNIKITGYASPELYKKYLNAADLAVQLRTLSRGETSGAVYDCMAHGLATIVNENGAMSELPDRCVIKIPDVYSDEELAAALDGLFADENKRQSLSGRSREYVRDKLSPTLITRKYYRAIEELYAKGRQVAVQKAVNSLAALEIPAGELDLWHMAARALARNIGAATPQRQLFIDISELVVRDAGSGIQRVVKSVLKELLENPPKGYRVEPVYALADGPGYRYARNYISGFIGLPYVGLHDEMVEYHPGDIFVGLDLQQEVVKSQKEILLEMRRFGVKIYFVVYDLLPIRFAEYFPADANAAFLHANWLSSVGECSDGLVCISASVANELKEWISNNPLPRHRPLLVDSFHLGSDIQNSNPTRGLPVEAGGILERLEKKTSFLMVGTIEPRKGCTQSLEAFEKLWADGHDVNLVIVGRQGWMIETLIDRINNHSELGKRLFWLKGISDEYLEKLYVACDCLILASEGEGFGLPLIEAAQHRLPIIARDLPVFHEVAGEHAFYFSGLSGDELADAIQLWLDQKRENKHPCSGDMTWLTWKQSTQQLVDIIL